MNILVVSEYFYPRLGGGELFLLDICSALTKRGHRVKVITARMENTVAREVVDGVEILRPFFSCKNVEQKDILGFMQSIRRVIFALRLGVYLRKLLRSDTPDIIYNFSYIPAMAVSWAATGNRCPAITNMSSQQGRNLFQSHNPVMAVLIYLVAIAILRFGKHDAIFCASQAEAHKLQRRSRAKSFVIRDPLDSEEIKRVQDKTNAKQLRRRLGIKDSDRFTVFVGRLVKIKNVDRLISVFSKLDRQYKLVVVGDGPERGNLERMVSRLGLVDRVKLIGSRPHEECLSIIRSSEVLVLPSSTEVFPGVILEALALGTPAIATRVGGVPEIQSPNLYMIDNVEEIEKLLRDGINRRQEDDILERYSLDKIVSEYEAMFRELVQDKASAAGLS